MSRPVTPSRLRASKPVRSPKRRRNELVLAIAPPAQRAVITILNAVARTNRRHAMALVEAVSTLVLTLPRWKRRHTRRPGRAS